MTLLSIFTAVGLTACSGGDKPAGDSADPSGTTDGGTTDGGTTDGGTTDGGDSGTDGGSGSTDPCTAEGIGVALGRGEDGYEPLDEGGTINLSYGDQGGWHYFVGFETYQSDSIVSFSVTGYDVETGSTICQSGDSPLQVALLPVDECRQVYYQIYCYVICPLDAGLVDGECDNPNEVLVGRDLRLEIELEDFEGQSASDSLVFVGGADGVNATDCVEDAVCSGIGE